MRIDDLLSECAKVLLFSFARNRGEKKEYKGELKCSGDAPDKESGQHGEAKPAEPIAHS